MQKIKNPALSAFKQAEAFAAQVAAVRSGHTNSNLWVGHIASEHVDHTIERKLMVIHIAKTREQRKEWVERSISLYNEWAKEINSMRKKARKSSSKWRRSRNRLDLTSIRSSIHQEVFQQLCNEAKEAFRDMVLEEVLISTKEGDSRSFINREVRKAVSHMQSLFASYMKVENKECKAIYSAALRQLWKQGYDAYCIDLGSKVINYYKGLVLL